MNPDTTPTYSLERQQSHGYASSGSESRKPSGSSGKKRASRAGTRSVTTLSAAQLERKRANDREAQRAIRQRTKDHIDNLEKNLNDLRGSQESNEKLVAITQQRNRELEEENAYLRSKLGESGYMQSMQQAPVQVADTASHQPPPAAYGQSSAQQRVDWTSAPQPYQYPNQEQQQTQRYENQPGPPPPPPPQQQQSYVQTPVQAFAPAPPPQAYHPPQLPPQAEFQNMAVSSPAGYQMQHQQQTYQQSPQPQAYPQQSFQQPTTYQITPVQMPVSAAEYVSPHSQMQPPPPMSTQSYHAPQQEQHYAPPPQQPHPPLQYRDDAAGRGYSMPHYPPG
ncbi:hypothetical protein LTR85_005408 [Meristemomyces frigidus]|nr:hypothetical protein LTR85_005408 [Meristemomyces frigidus]